MFRPHRPFAFATAVVTVACVAAPALAGDCVTGQSCFSPQNSGGCNLASCCSEICAQDPFCCDVEWDQVCVDAALVACADCGTEGAGSCVEAGTTAGCDSVACCALVCDVDPFCCSNFWDSVCADEGVALCTGCGGVLSGACWEANGSPACEDAACCDLVCADDAFCCETSWDGVCAGSAFELCGGCGQADSGPCFSGNGTPGCSDASCCEMVCMIDLDCCEQAWDISCAFQAQNICCSTICPGDLNNDEAVDGADIGLLLGDWGQSGTCADLDGNGTVDGADLGVLLASWGFCVQ